MGGEASKCCRNSAADNELTDKANNKDTLNEEVLVATASTFSGARASGARRNSKNYFGRPRKGSDASTDADGLENWSSVFKELDKDGDGIITREEMHHAFFGWMRIAPDPESACFETLRTCFPNSVPCHVICTRATETLLSKNIVPDNTICATSICPDEINFCSSGLTNVFWNHWGASYPMGGLGGVPFTGKSGYRAICRHMPKDGNVIILFGPHISISESGELAKVLRRGQTQESNSCGALCHAQSSLRSSVHGAQGIGEYSDMQMDWLKQHVAKMRDIPDREKSDAALHLVHKFVELINSMMLDITKPECLPFASPSNLILIGGVQINLPQPFDDHFEPVVYKIVRQDGTEEDLIDCFKPPLHGDAQSDSGVYSLLSWLHWSPAPSTACFDALHKFFPGVMPAEMIVRLVSKSLENRGFNAENTIFGQSCCPDEINTEKGGFLDRLVEQWGEVFPLGGISGAPFTGKTGFAAFSGHVPTDGNVLICFGPHIAISEAGQLGKVLRFGQENHSSACGAVLAAYNSCAQENCSTAHEELDMQQSWLRQAIKPKMEKIRNAQEPLDALIHEFYETVKEQILQIVNHNFGTGRLVLLGGIQINMPHTFKDHFQPLMFKLFHKSGQEEDLLPEASLGRSIEFIDIYSKTPVSPLARQISPFSKLGSDTAIASSS